MEKQVDKSKYNFKEYCSVDRFASYWNQINEITKLDPKKILEIGVGDKVLADYLLNNTNIQYTSMDIAEDLKPDIIGNIENIPVKNESYDIVCAFEVLEHLPFEKFGKILKEMGRASSGYVIISLPHWGRHFSIDIRIPFFKRLKFQYKINLFPIKHKFNGQHYWEIGKSGYDIRKIREKIIENNFKILNDFVAFDSPYHHFFILKK